MRDRGFAFVASRIIERCDLDALDRAWIEAAHVDVNPVGIGARNIETLDSAMTAEAMLRGAGIERVLGQRIGTAEQAKPMRRHDQVQEAAHPADRTIAIKRDDRRRRIDFKTDATAMATAVVHDEYGAHREAPGNT